MEEALTNQILKLFYLDPSSVVCAYTDQTGNKNFLWCPLSRHGRSPEFTITSSTFSSPGQGLVRSPMCPPSAPHAPAMDGHLRHPCTTRSRSIRRHILHGRMPIHTGSPGQIPGKVQVSGTGLRPTNRHGRPPSPSNDTTKKTKTLTNLPSKSM